jgi:carboxymethylenebutenolidase
MTHGTVGTVGKVALALLVATAGASAAVRAQEPAGEAALPAALLGKAEPPKGQHVQYDASNPAARGYLAVPEGDGPFGSVILIHEWNGLVDRVRQVADAFADQGYVALAADLYSGRTGSSPEENMVLVRETLAAPEAIIANLDAAAAFVRERDDTSGKVATIGWCYGGGVALSYALGGENHDATAIFYGRLLDDPEQLKHLNHEIYGTFAGLDRGPSPEQVGSFVEALRAAGIENDIHIYDDVNHGFWLWVERDPATAEAPALDAWQRLNRYLERTLGDE